ncbi:hypothetical protein ACLI1A_07555 [Flavobacterium sp. RHBU_3]|uniref:hypothetical protein n=1 Tax=Flavobacterium sp. RHBU_3 TaxID=3391184 RepID=UPI003985537A
MKLKILLILLLPIFAGAQNNELFSWQTGKVSNKIPMHLTLAEFEKVYKKADSITTALPEQLCNNETDKNGQMLYYKGARYLLVNGTLSFRELDFSPRKNMYFQQKDDWFDHTTTLKSFGKTYPDAAALVDTEDDGTDEPWEIISLLPEEKDINCLWMFYFKKGKLRKIKCEFSCK